ncbi:YchJ family metal-binding protein [Nitratifractor sp.]|uniref:YchJ family protein n=1 Tax=Nitratifractor sp. TaxID=2268144 RepID=UPI0025F0195D|nr:YchJ family metal-binding protein [Nitratifractor sp.]
MKILSPNAPCPCGSGNKYKRCCRPYHQGKRAPDALTLMKSRYSAYAAGEADYILRTTHPLCPEYSKERKRWKAEVERFSRQTDFLRLDILEYQPGEAEAFVLFRARFRDGVLIEKSRFLCVEGEWLYRSGEFLPEEEKKTVD